MKITDENIGEIGDHLYEILDEVNVTGRWGVLWDIASGMIDKGEIKEIECDDDMWNLKEVLLMWLDRLLCDPDMEDAFKVLYKKVGERLERFIEQDNYTIKNYTIKDEQ